MKNIKSVPITNVRLAGKNALLFFLLLLFSQAINAQVQTTVLRGLQPENYIPYYDLKQIPASIVLPKVDIPSELAIRQQSGRTAPVYGIVVPTNIKKGEGTIENNAGMAIWRTCIQSYDAASLNVQLSHLVLPEGSEMYVYDKQGTMVSGPITSQHVYDGIYATEVIKGEEIVLEVIVPESSIDQFDISIHTVVHGIKKTEAEFRAYEDSKWCSVDVNCPLGTGWQNERDAVGLVFNAQGEWCSGALMNNSCQSLRPFFLTAQHCLDGSESSWVFRFNYDSPNPFTPTCRGDEPVIWTTYSGSALRASNTISDFALVELNGSVIGQSTLALAGWSRGTNIPSSPVTSISHPEGDVKKIASDGDAVALGGTNFWLIDAWDIGLVQQVSSGSPLFDSNRRVVGQLSGGDNNIGCTGTGGSFVDNNQYGRFDRSWAGSGASSNRLSSWLGGSIAGTANTIRAPYINGTGPVCNASNKTFTLVNLIPGRTATWTATPASLLVTASGSGTTANLRAASTTVSGFVTLTFTISAANGCTTIPVSRSIWVGKPSPNMTVSPSSLCHFSNGFATLSDGGQSGVTWAFGGVISGTGNGITGAYYNSGSVSGGGVVMATPDNTCGVGSTISRPISVNSCFKGNNGSAIRLIPNPAKLSVMVDLSGSDLLQSDAAAYSIKVFNNLGEMVLDQKVEQDKEILETINLSPGLYFVEVTNGASRIIEKLIITK